MELRPRVAYRAVVLALVLLAAGLLFKQLAELALLVVIAIIIALPLAAGAEKLARFRVPRPLGALLSLLMGGAIVGVILFFAIPAFVDQVNGFVNQLPTTVAHFEVSLNHTFGLKPGTVTAAVQKFVTRYTRRPTTLLGPLSSIGVSVATAAGAAVVVAISAIYMAVSPRPLAEGLIRLFGPAHYAQTRHTLERIRRAWLGWLRALFVDMLVVGGLLYLGLKLDGLPFAIGFAMFSALLTVIPGYGPVISALPPIIFGLTYSWERGVLIAVIYVLAYQLDGRIVPAAIRGEGIKLHPAVIAIGTLISASLFGVLGLFVAVPLICLALIAADELWVKPYGSVAPARPSPVARLAGPPTGEPPPS